jgi:MoaA/NifB/PqqE/SkfB family radical SAM enzyme
VRPKLERGILKLAGSRWPARGLSAVGRVWPHAAVSFLKRFFSETDPRCRAKIVEHLLLPAGKARGSFPPVVFLSLTTRCQLRCPGCSVRKDAPIDMSFELADRIVSESRSEGTRFFILLGGEPLLWPGLADLISGHPDAYFQISTNGLLVDRALAKTLRKAGNAALTFSLDGPEDDTDRRRGPGVFRGIVEGMAAARAEGIPLAADVLVGRDNFAVVQSDAFIRDLVSRGVFMLYYLPYKPVGETPDPAQVLTPEERRVLYRRVVALRSRYPLVTVDHEYDMGPLGGCIASQGLAIYISAAGLVQPCSNLHYGDVRLDGRVPVGEAVRSSVLLRRMGELNRPRAGCPLTDRPGELKSLIEDVFPRTCRDFPDFEFLCEYARAVPAPTEDVYSQDEYDLYAGAAAMALRPHRRKGVPRQSRSRR